VPLGWPRVAVGILGALMFAVCFTPEPFIIGWADYAELFRALFQWILT
jgi:O-antigen/teichoic acid export membrane protein